jgi:hypothetical protein
MGSRIEFLTANLLAKHMYKKALQQSNNSYSICTPQPANKSPKEIQSLTILNMKFSTLISTSILSATATMAWQIQFHTRNNIGLTMHGTKDAACNTIGWNSGRVKEDVEYIK